MLDDRLVGYWSDESVYQGAMEVTDIAFRRDGTGWTYWSRDGGGFEVFRFSWHTAADHQLTIDLQELLSGNWDLTKHAVQHHVRSKTRWDKQIVVAYEVIQGLNVFRKPATLLRLNRPISVGTVGDQFALKRQLAETDHDPTTPVLRNRQPSPEARRQRSHGSRQQWRRRCLVLADA